MQVDGRDKPPQAPLVLTPQFFGSIVFDRRTSRYLPFDLEATALLRRLGHVPFDAVVRQTPDAATRRAMERFFEHFDVLGFFTLDRRFAGHILELEPPDDHLAGPLALHLEVVASCNLKCQHCFAGPLPRRDRPLTLDELDGLFASVARVGTFRLGLTGGEPLLRRDLFDVIDLALDHGLCPCVTTNGLLIDERVAREFGRRELAWLNVSLEGARPETNDLVRGPGTFDRVVEKLAILARHTKFTLAFTIMRTNVDEVQACADLAARVGAHTAVFRPLYPVGVAREHLDLMPTFQQYGQALDRLAEAATGGGYDVRDIDPFSPRARQERQAVVHQNLGCGAGNLVCSVSVSGDVNPCSFLGRDYVAANIRDRSLEDIWHNSQGFRDIRALPGGNTCGGCDSQDGFSGGCRARALTFNGSINAPDPWINEYATLAAHDDRQRTAGGGLPRHPLHTLELAALAGRADIQPLPLLSRQPRSDR
jgi:radical SAM protein with 4Fe4S-binding SPASM domain